MQGDFRVDFLGYEQKKIGKGERAGQIFYVVRFIVENDTIEVLVFSDRSDIISTILKAEKYEKMIATFKISQNSGNTKLELLELVKE